MSRSLILINEIGNRFVIDCFRDRKNLQHQEYDNDNHLLENIYTALDFHEFAANVIDSYSILIVAERNNTPMFIYNFLKYTITPNKGVRWIEKMKDRILLTLPQNLIIKDVIISDIHGNFHFFNPSNTFIRCNCIF